MLRSVAPGLWSAGAENDSKSRRILAIFAARTAENVYSSIAYVAEMAVGQNQDRRIISICPFSTGESYRQHAGARVLTALRGDAANADTGNH